MGVAFGHLCSARLSSKFLREMTAMKRKKILLFLALAIVIACGCLSFVACGKDKDNYPVEGVWHAVAAWQEESTFTFGGYTSRIIDNYKIDLYFDFRADGSILKKSVASINDHVMHTDNEEWNIFNLTWSVKGNVITLSSGKQFVIVDDEFDDIFPAKNILLRYKKEATENDVSAQRIIDKTFTL